MTAVKEFIKSACKKIHVVFPKTTLKYEYKAFSDTHFIKITPSDIYNKDAFIDLSFELSDEFDDSFSGVLCFIKNEELSEMNDPEVIFCPKEEKIFTFSYKDFFNSFGLGTDNPIVLGEKPVVVSLTQVISEDLSSLENTQYAMAA